MPSFYIPNLKEDTAKIKIEKDEFHHIVNVFRKKVEDEIVLNNGDGLLAKAIIREQTKRHVSVEILSYEKKEKSSPHYAIAFSLLRNKNDFLLVEKITELGVYEMFPFMSKFSVRQANKNTTAKFEKSAISAIKQCDGAFLPKINETKNLKIVLQMIQKKGYLPIIASEKIPDQTLAKIMKDNEQSPICFVIGPEGGFSDEEFAYFEAENFLQCKLGNHILRGETAAITALAQLTAFQLARNIRFY